MYCPNCGFNNQAEIKFCTRCGTNLNIVSEALAGRPAVQPKTDDRMVAALRDYYLSRRSTLIGGLTFPMGLALLIAWSVIGFPDTFAVLALLGLALAIYGAIYAVWGVEHWISSSSELKAFKTVNPQVSVSNASQVQPGRATSASLSAPVEHYPIDPIEPASVTERTTHFLDERIQSQTQAQSKDH